MSQIDTQPLHDEAAGQEQPRKTKVNYGREFLAGLAVSFAALSLGAAFGDQSGRGPLKGVLSAGFLALITSSVGGTVVQCSGPTAPMAAVAACQVGKLIVYVPNVVISGFMNGIAIMIW